MTSLLTRLVRFATILSFAATACSSSPPLPRIAKVPEAKLTSASGKPIELSSLRGNVVVYDFIFTNCAGICPLMTQSLKKITREVGDASDVRFVSISVDPERDTLDVLRKYSAAAGTDPRWVFATGDKASVTELSTKGFMLAANNDDPNAILHSSRFIVADREGMIRGYYEGTDEEGVRQTIAAVRTLLDEER